MNWLKLFAYLGVFVFAIAGVLKARTHSMDILGALVVAFVTAYGGGTIRDIILGINPLNWMNDNFAVLLVFFAVFIVFLLKENITKIRKIIFLTDAFGLGLFTSVGIKVSLNNGVNEIYSIIMGIITATFGGFISDIIVNEVPSLLKKSELYATACLIGGVQFVFFLRLNMSDELNMSLCVTLVVLIRILSRYIGIYTPNI